MRIWTWTTCGDTPPSLLHKCLAISIAVCIHLATLVKGSQRPRPVRTVGELCDPDDLTWYAVPDDPTQFLYCNKLTKTLKKDSCATVYGIPKVFDEVYQQCLQASSVFSLTKPFQAAAASGKVGDQCDFNTDCLDGMFCSQGQCVCLSNYVQRGDYCYEKINPTQSGCSYDEQCSAVWPDATCDQPGGSGQGRCKCPEAAGFGRAVETRDGWVCLAAGDPMCPLPQDAGTLSTLFRYQGTVASVETCNPQSADITNAIDQCFSGTTGGDVGGYYVGDLYDCIAQAGNPTLGVCCPNRALACNLPVAEIANATDTRWFYNPISGSCLQFRWDKNAASISAVGNANNFITRIHCESYCRDSCPRGIPQYDGATPITSSRPLTCSTTSCDSNHACSNVGSSSLCCPTPTFICKREGGLPNPPPNTAAPPNGVQTPFNPGIQSNVPRLNGRIRYYYNQSSSSCESFTWYQQGGNFNNFASKDDCETYCEQILCDQGDPLKDGTGHNQQCSGNAQCPSSFSCQNNVCCPRRQTVCEMPKQVGTCRGFVQRYWYNAVTKECELFTYSGCQGNGNNFKDLVNCQSYCRNTQAKPNCIQGQAYKDANGNYYTCSSGGVANRCPANFECYFDGFLFGCCPLREYTCGLSKNQGVQCGPKTVRWFFDTTTQTCQTFEYLGCDGNSNLFATRDLCENYCGVGGCPNGGQPFREPNGAVRICSTQITCPTTHECITTTQGTAGINYCCPTKAYICSLPPYQGTNCGSSTLTRYYFNLATRSCRTFNYYGCSGNGNSFATLAQCQDYCNAAACDSGEAAFVDMASNKVFECNVNLKDSCPSGFKCKFDSLTTRYVCCGATDMGVCPKGEKAFVDARTLTARTCRPNIQGTCPSQFLCRFSQPNNAYYCCASATGELCPKGKAPFRDPSTEQVMLCALNSVINVCPVGYSCQTAVTSTITGYCCTIHPICPNAGEYYQAPGSVGPRSCVLGLGLDNCPATYSCIATPANQTGVTSFSQTGGYCCRGGMNVCSGGIAYQIENAPVTCQIDQTNACPLGYTCSQYMETSTYYCCAPASLGCPLGSTALIENGAAKTCLINIPNNCPIGYGCFFIQDLQRFQCCSGPTITVGICPPGMSGNSQSCVLSGINTCPSGYTCQYSAAAGTYQCCQMSGQQPLPVVIPLPPPPTTCSIGSPYMDPSTNNIRECAAATDCPLGFTCEQKQQNSICCGQATQPQPAISQICPPTSSVAIDGTNRPLTCSLSQQTCPIGYSCVYNNMQRLYYCCTQTSGSIPFIPTATGTYGCAKGRAYLYPGTTDPLVCRPSVDRCPLGYSCEFAAGNRRYQCCTAGRARPIANETREAVEANSLLANEENNVLEFPGVQPHFPHLPRADPKQNQLVFPFPSPATTDRIFSTFMSITTANYNDCPPGQKGLHCDLSSGILIGGCCWPKLAIGQPCIRDDQCSWQHYLAKCRDRLCRCPLFMVAVDSPTGYGMTCATNCPSTFVPDRITAICRPVEYREPEYPYKDHYDSGDSDSDSGGL